MSIQFDSLVPNGLSSPIEEKLRGDQVYRASANALLDLFEKRSIDQPKRALTWLLDAFKQKRLETHVQSWIAHKKNIPISVSEVESGLKAAEVFDDLRAVVVEQANLGQSEVEDKFSKGVAELLPFIVESISPDGSQPSAEGLKFNIQLLRRRTGLG